MQDKDAAKLQKTYGGVEGLASALHVDISEGLNAGAAGDKSMESRQAAFGANRCLSLMVLFCMHGSACTEARRVNAYTSRTGHQPHPPPC